jgi:hypothetical protein
MIAVNAVATAKVARNPTGLQWLQLILNFSGPSRNPFAINVTSGSHFQMIIELADGIHPRRARGIR